MKKPYSYTLIAITLILAAVFLLSYLLKVPAEEAKETLNSSLKEQKFKKSNQSISPVIELSTDKEDSSEIGSGDSTKSDPAGGNINPLDLLSENKITPQIDVDVDSFNLPEKLLKPAAETKISRVPRARLTSDNLEILDFINNRRIQNSLDVLDTLPTRLNTEEVLQLTNAKRVSDGLEPLSEMPTGMPEVDENQ